MCHCVQDLFQTETLAGLTVDCENAILFNCKGDHTEGQQDMNKAERCTVPALKKKKVKVFL
jgi:hypothetical protein